MELAIIITFVSATAGILLQLVTLLVRQLSKDKNYNRYFSVKKGRAIGKSGGIDPYDVILRDDTDERNTIMVGMNYPVEIEPQVPVTSSFAYVYVRMYDLQSQAIYETCMTSEVLVGRSGAGANIQLPDNRVSGKHFKLLRRGNGIFLQDMGSTNKTYLNNCVVQHEMPLQIGDVIRAGNTYLKFEYYNMGG